jgi:hypothetical protein
MKEVDIPKTTFNAHEENYEFWVHPFGLSNASSTYQNLMNKLLQPFLRNFVLVFYDDILIYNKIQETHVAHVDQALQLI